jgi:two-component system OmpR family sensor kinase/two-component system sensor histidine kinase QseC
MLDRMTVARRKQRAFIADAAHELRSPLTAVRLQLQLLDRAPDEAARGQARSALGAAVERAVHMVEQLLTLARNEPQAQPASMQALSLSEVAAQALADAHVLAESRHIELLLEGAPELRVRGDAEALRSLVRNLVDNAVRYSPPGSRVRVRVDETTQGARLEVHDSGPGIPPAERARAFDRFHRRASAPEGGCGLGLAIVKAVADRHGATVVLGDSPDGGLAVTVSFPPMTGQLGRSQGVLAQDSIAGESA